MRSKSGCGFCQHHDTNDFIFFCMMERGEDIAGAHICTSSAGRDVFEGGHMRLVRKRPDRERREDTVITYLDAMATAGIKIKTLCLILKGPASLSPTSSRLVSRVASPTPTLPSSSHHLDHPLRHAWPGCGF